MSNFLNKIPVSPITSFGNPSVPNGSTIGTNFSILQTGGFMEVYTLSGLTYTIPPATTGIIEFSGNSIPIQLTKGSGSVFSPDVLTLNSDNISSGRRKLGMLAYVYETNKIYQFRIDNYDALWGNATGATGPGGPTVVISNFGTTVKNNSAAGIAFINAWTSSTISGVGGYNDTNASWRVLSTGGGTSVTGGTFNNNTDTLTLNNSTGGTVTITGFTDYYTTGFTFNPASYDLTIKRNDGLPDLSVNLSILSSDVTITGGTYNSSTGTATFTNNTGGTFNVTGFLTGFTDIYVTGGTFNNNNQTLTLTRTDNVNVNVSGFTDVFVTGGTYSGSTIIFRNNSGGTFNVTGITTSSTFTGGTVTGATSFTGGLTANTISATTYQNLPVSGVTGGTGISANTTNGLVTIVNTAPDQVVTISGGTGISTGGTYPNFVLTNTSPDQTVTITGGTNIEIEGIYPNFGINFTGSTGASGDFLPLSGGTVSGATTFTGGLTANTISAITYQNLPIDVRVTGGTYNTGSSSITFTNNTGGTFNVTGITSSSGGSFTGGTVSGPTEFTGGLTANTISATTYQNLPTDIRVTGGTYSNGTATFTNNTGGTFNVTGLYTGGTDVFVTGATKSGDIATFTNNTGGTFTLTGLTDTFVTGGTYDTGSSSITFTNNSGGTFNVSGITSSGGGSFTGGTVSGATSFTGGLTANTISATTITSPSISPYGLIVATSIGYQNIF